jgi:hypothetical protein
LNEYRDHPEEFEVNAFVWKFGKSEDFENYLAPKVHMMISNMAELKKLYHPLCPS